MLDRLCEAPDPNGKCGLCRERTVDSARTHRKPQPDGTQEVAAVDILEETPLVDASADEIPIEVELAPPPQGPTSLAPLSVSVLPSPRPAAESTFKIDAVRVPRRRLGGVVTGAMAMAVCILVVAGVRASMASPVEPAPPPVAATLPPVQPAPAAQPWKTASATDSSSTSGTVTSRGGALFIDGARISAKSALVSCGHHQVKAGRGKPHDVDVPCGGAVVVDRAGKTTITR
jgi:hypothetical protein